MVYLRKKEILYFWLERDEIVAKKVKDWYFVCLIFFNG